MTTVTSTPPNASSGLAAVRRAWAAFARRPESGAILSLLVIGIFLSLATSQFLTVGNLMLVARGFAFTAIAAMGAFLVIVTGGIDLSVGSVMGLAGLTAAFLSASGVNFVLALLAGLAAGVVVGFLNGLLTAHMSLAPFMVTLGMLSVVRGIDIAITGGTPIQGIDPAITWLGQGYVLGIPVPVWIMIVLGIVLTLVMKRTTFGWYVYSIGGNVEAARLSGVRVRRVKTTVYTIAGLLAAVGGILLTARLGVGESTSGTGYELDVIAAAVIGGTSLTGGQGSIAGAIWGAALLGVVRNGLVLLGVSDFWQTIAIGLVIIFAVVIDRYRSRPAA
jgi:ribose transport system permease protein